MARRDSGLDGYDFTDLGDVLLEDALDARPQSNGRHRTSVACSEEAHSDHAVLHPNQLYVSPVRLHGRPDLVESPSDSFFHQSSLVLNNRSPLDHDGGQIDACTVAEVENAVAVENHEVG